MLTREILAANAQLSGLTEEQIKAIITLSENGENSVIAKKTGEIYGALDNDILTVSGIAKNGTEKTYDYAKRVMSAMKADAEAATGYKSQIDALTKEKARLEKAIADGAADAETAKDLKQAKADLANITTQYNELNTKYTDIQEAHKKELFAIKIDSELQTAAGGIKFKAGLPEAVTRVILQQATEKIKGMNPEYIDDGKGGKILAFKDETGAIMRNPNNQLNPFGASDLLQKELKTMGVLDEGRQAGGGGTHGGTGGTGNQTVLDVSGAKSRNEAYEAITNHLLAQGLTIGSADFDAAMTQAWKDNNISSLPETA